MRYPSLIPVTSHSDANISDFLIYHQHLVKENCHNSRTSSEIDTKPGPATKPDKENTATSKKFSRDIMPASYDVIELLSFFQSIAK